MTENLRSDGVDMETGEATSAASKCPGNYSVNSRYSKYDWVVRAIEFDTKFGFNDKSVLDEKVKMYLRCIKEDWSVEP